MPYENLVVYSDSSITVPVSIENSGIKDALYNILLTGSAAEFSKINPTTIKIEPGKTETTFLYIAPRTTSALGNYEARLTFSADNGEALDYKDIKLELTNEKSRATKISSEEKNNASESADNTKEKTRLTAIFLRAKNWIKARLAKQETQTSQNDTFTETENIVQETKAGKFVKQYRYHILTAIIVIVIIILIISFGLHKKAVDFFEEDDEENKTRKKKTKKESSEIKRKVEE